MVTVSITALGLEVSRSIATLYSHCEHHSSWLRSQSIVTLYSHCEHHSSWPGSQSITTLYSHCEHHSYWLWSWSIATLQHFLTLASAVAGFYFLCPSKGYVLLTVNKEAWFPRFLFLYIVLEKCIAWSGEMRLWNEHSCRCHFSVGAHT